jgi:hypothetical protein
MMLTAREMEFLRLGIGAGLAIAAGVAGESEGDSYLKIALTLEAMSETTPLIEHIANDALNGPLPRDVKRHKKFIDELMVMVRPQ